MAIGLKEQQNKNKNKTKLPWDPQPTCEGDSGAQK